MNGQMNVDWLVDGGACRRMQLHIFFYYERTKIFTNVKRLMDFCLSKDPVIQSIENIHSRFASINSRVPISDYVSSVRSVCFFVLIRSI